MAVYRVAVKGFDSDSLMGSRAGHVFAAYQLDHKFGDLGEKDYFGIAIDLPDDHPLVQNLGGQVPARDGYKHRYRLNWTRAGISDATLAQIKDRNVISPWRPDKISRPDVLVDRNA